MTIQQITSLALLSGLTSGGLVAILNKIGVLDWYEIHKKKYMPERCDFCLGFWFSVFICFIYAIAFGWHTVGQSDINYAVFAAIIPAFIVAKFISK
jgi:hypothetical protein